MTVQSATHLLLAKLFPQDETLLVERKLELEKFLVAVKRASVVAADQNKVLTIQIQFVQPGRRTIRAETDGTVWRDKLSDFAQECGLIRGSQIRFTHLHSVSSGHAHLLESHAK